jgi:hypothetical protein
MTMNPRLPEKVTDVLIVHPMESYKIMSAPEIICGPRPEVGATVSRAALGFVLLLAFLPAVGCAMKKMAPPPPPPPPDLSIVGRDDDRLQESLFKGDQAVLSNQDIDRILAARITLEDRHRLAVLRLNSRNTWYQDIADLEAQNSERFLKALGSLPK